MIKVEDVSFSYRNGVNALDSVSFTLSNDNPVAILGPNGSGKTTILKVLGLIYGPLKGKILYDGVDVHSLSETDRLELRRKVVYVHQTPIMFRETVYDNVAYGLRIRALAGEVVRSKTDAMLELTGLENHRERFAPSLSLGERQRVSLARALALEPAYVLLDEPTSSLDPENTQLVESILMKISREVNARIILATHNIFQARRLSRSTIFLYRGKVIEYGLTKEVLFHPREDLARRFVSGEIS